MTSSPDSFTFTVGKLDAGMAILLGERAHLIEFPSVLLPPGAGTGSIVNIAVHQNHSEEQKREKEFWDLQDAILEEFGHASPEPPKLSVRNVTQTSVTLEWEPMKLATAKVRSLDIYRNGERLSAVPAPTTNTSTKHSGMEINTEYTFQLILRTSAGTFPSNLIRLRTHTMQDTSGICVCFGNIQDVVLLENAKLALREMGAKWSDRMQIDTSHFVCTTPAATTASGVNVSAPGVQYQRALQLSIPIVQPYWILACHSEKRMVPIAHFYLGASSPSANSNSFNHNATTNNRPVSMSQASLAGSGPNQRGSQISSGSSKASPLSSSYRASMPAPSRLPDTPPSNASAFINQSMDSAAPRSGKFEQQQQQQQRPREEEEEEEGRAQQTTGLENSAASASLSPNAEKRRSRSGSINKGFRFPSVSSPSGGPSSTESASSDETSESRAAAAGGLVPPRRQSTIEVPAPPPVEKEPSLSSNISLAESGDDDVGPTEEISLN